jgi:hypothetical protein
VLTIQERDGVTETLTAADVGMVYQDTGEVDALLAGYNPALWFIDFFTTDDLTVNDASISIDEDKATAAIEKLNCYNPALVTKPVDAQLVFEDGVCTLQAEVEGNQLNETQSKHAILAALKNYQSTIDLDAEGCYLEPNVTSEDEQLQSQMEQASALLSAKITYDFEDDRIETVDGSVIQDWLVVDENGNYDIDTDLAFDWVKRTLAYQYDTFGLTHTFTTTNGQTVTLKGGDYGWCIARQDTTDALVAAIKAGETTQLTPAYQYTAKNRGINDIGGTYVEISIEAQHVWCYKDGKLVVEGDCVTGNLSKGYDTPSGSVWAIDAKKSPATLGTLDTMGYSSPVTYWMPFTGNVGMHDADGWRSKYGGTIYKTNGSHGCVNLPKSVAEVIYKTVEIGTAVIVY